MNRIFIAGSINMDVVAQTERHPRPGETLFGRDLTFIPGGKGSNQAVAAGRLRDEVWLLGKLGRDAFGASLHEFLQGENLKLDYLRFDDEAPTGTALIVVNAASENTIVVIAGSNGALTPEDVNAPTIRAEDYVAAVFEIPQATILSLFQRARTVGARTVLNPAPAAAFIPDLLENVTHLVVNETELAFFAGTDDVPEDETSIRQAAETLRISREQTIIVTLGAKGALCLAGDEVIRVTGRPVKAVDTTGAGDCFVGALTVALSEGQSLSAALNFANAAAALSVQQLGASRSMPNREALERALKA